jgi:hypothetical protein
MIALGEWEDVIEVVSFYPILILPGDIAFIGSGFEQPNDDNFDRNGSIGRRGLAERSGKNAEKQEWRSNPHIGG